MDLGMFGRSHKQVTALDRLRVRTNVILFKYIFRLRILMQGFTGND